MGITWLLQSSLLLCLPMLLQSAKILTVALVGGSHYLLLDEISHNFHQQGHDVRMLLQLGTPVITGFSYAKRADSYQTTTWSVGDEYIEEYNAWFLEQQKEFLQGRDSFSGFLKFMDHLSYQCDQLLGDEDMLDFLLSQRYDMAIIDAFNPCSFILARKLGVRYVAFSPGGLNGPLSLSLPSPVSYVPHFGSQLSHQMHFWERVMNLLFSLMAPIGQGVIWSRFKEVAEQHLDSGSPPGGLEELFQKAELWAFNTDFSLEFPQPLLPNTVLVGGLLNKPAKPLDQELEAWVSGCGQAGFIVVTLGSMVSAVSVEHLLVEMSAGFSSVPQCVLWRYDVPRWPSHLATPPNVRLATWLPMNDLLGHPRVRVFVTHGGQNSLLQAVYHGVPVLAIPLFGDQFDNVIRAEAKGLGLSLWVQHITRERVATAIQTLTREERFKTSAATLSRIHQSQPVPPGLRLTQWVEHILHSGGGAHLQPMSYFQHWYQRWLLDILLLFSLVLLGAVVLCRAVVRRVKRRESHQKIQ